MNITDPIADYLTRIRNASKAHLKKVDIPSSTLKKELSKILKEKKYIADYSETADNKQGILRIQLRYVGGECVIKGLQRVSTPGLRVYVGSEDLPRVLGGLGIAIISTSKGLMTDHHARHEKIGGEVLCNIW
jgi:small subunit ribosomal protein S8